MSVATVMDVTNRKPNHASSTMTMILIKTRALQVLPFSRLKLNETFSDINRSINGR